jgi:hypothetical protein
MAGKDGRDNLAAFDGRLAAAVRALQQGGTWDATLRSGGSPQQVGSPAATTPHHGPDHAYPLECSTSHTFHGQILKGAWHRLPRTRSEPLMIGGIALRGNRKMLQC